MASLLDTIPYRPVQTNIVQKPIENEHLQSNVSFKNRPTRAVKTAALTGSVVTTLAYLFLLAKHLKKGNFKTLRMLDTIFDFS